MRETSTKNNVIPAQAGIHTPKSLQFISGSLFNLHRQGGVWIPSFDGMTVLFYFCSIASLFPLHKLTYIINSLFNRFNPLATRRRRAFDQDHRNPQLSGRLQFAIGRGAATIFGDDQLDLVSTQKHQLICRIKGTTGQNIFHMGQSQRWGDGVDAAHNIMMLRRLQQRGKLLPSKRNKNAAWGFAQLLQRLFDACHVLPAIPRDRSPRRAAQDKEIKSCALSGFIGMGRNGGGERVGGVNQQVSFVVKQIGDQPLHTPKAASAHRHGLGRGGLCASGQRQGDGEIQPPRQRLGQQAGFISAAKNEKSGAHV